MLSAISSTISKLYGTGASKTLPISADGFLETGKTVLAHDHSNSYIKILDNVFSPEECASLIALAESDQEWHTAKIQTHVGDLVDLEYRNNDRILRFDHKAAADIYQRLVNERLSFLRYGPGHFFKPHCDGLVELPDGRRSFVTIQIYLNDEGLSGGATRIFGTGRRHLDIEPKLGRVLIFQQRAILHCGMEVMRGTKYAMRSDLMFEKVFDEVIVHIISGTSPLLSQGNRAQSRMVTKRTVLGQYVPVAEPVDLSNTIIATDYPTAFIKVLDNVFTAKECDALVARAEAGEQWRTAMIQTRSGDRVDTDTRNNDRILLFDRETADELFQRLLPHVEELNEIGPGGRWEGVVGTAGRVSSTWKLLGINERLSFLRYGSGHYFKPHFDGQILLPDGRKSWVTLQIYLNDVDLSGGATRIFGKRNGRFLDVEPKVGRVLIFEQGPFYHSGEEVVQGMKYTMRSDFLFERVA
ncbi:hypothetical protein DXG01_017017 [Tephrocybe rancida]|nr:hypothetical protein DXG01_017017 [Tephrocybe rancida]